MKYMGDMMKREDFFVMGRSGIISYGTLDYYFNDYLCFSTGIHGFHDIKCINNSIENVHNVTLNFVI